jgi:rsbT co-antagonist protein RsbR
MDGDFMKQASRIAQVVQKHESKLLPKWIEHQSNGASSRAGQIKREELEDNSREFLRLFSQALNGDGDPDSETPQWTKVHDFLSGMSRSRSKLGFTPSETARFVFSLKQPLFDVLRTDLKNDPDSLINEIWLGTRLLDDLGLYTTEVSQKGREEVILRQQQEMLELSTPVVELWQGVLALPLIGTLDSARTQVVMENLLQKIVETGSAIAIIDITGVPTVDTLVAQHLLKTVAAARLMGAECMISGIRPQIAQTIVHLGVDLTSVITKASLADAFAVALEKSNFRISPKSEV